ncbi:MAG: glutamine--fructose-6-phosphate transaminase (isomerizing) [Mangrovicoccus sp.]
MCGIVGVLGDHEVAPILVEGLKRLEYRGYDSAGLATIGAGGRLDTRRELGKLVNLSDLLVHNPLSGKAGIGHTRWATHGQATVANAHPHRSGPVAVVHNGIIENFRHLRSALAADGYHPKSQTDTEIVALLTHRHMDQGMSPLEAVRATLSMLRGAFALAFLFEGEEDLMIAARSGSPLAVGYGQGEMYIGSDAIALGPLTDRICYLDEGDIAVITRAGAEIWDANQQLANRPVQTVSLDQVQVDRGGYKHFMAKEIAEQPGVMRDSLAAYVNEAGKISFPEGAEAIDFTKLERLTLIACGTAYYACMVAKYWFESLARLPVEVDIASEFRYREPPMPANSMAIVVSQSGETADTLAALRYVVSQGVPVGSVVNVPESSIARESAPALPTLAGTEIGVASTKAFTCQLTVLACLALQAAEQRGTIEAKELLRLTDALGQVPRLMNTALGLGPAVAEICGSLAEAQDVLFLGRGALFPLAMEGALKLKEISYIHAEGYASGELKHGPIALIDRQVPVIVLAPRDPLFEKTVSNMQEVMARHGRVLLVTDASGAAEAGEGLWETIEMPDVDPVWAPILYAIPAQLIAYHTAIHKGTDVDQPRNLAKSVTVE